VNKLRRHPYEGPIVNDEVHSLLGLDETNGAHVDVENFSDGNDIWGPGAPWNNGQDYLERLDPPLRIAVREDMWGNELAGVSGATFPYPVPQGQHGFALPGEMTDWGINICKQNYGSNDPQCEVDQWVGKRFDVGWFMFHTFGRFLLGEHDSPYAIGCISKDVCPGWTAAPVPPLREPDELP
jgi:hypothetical protein